MWGPRLSGRAKLDSLFDLELSDCRLLNPSPCGLRLFQDVATVFTSTSCVRFA